MSTFACETCLDFYTIDRGGREIACPDCSPVTIKISGLGHGMGDLASYYFTAAEHTGSSITFKAASYNAIINDVANVTRSAKLRALVEGRKGRNSTSSWAIAIDKRVRAAVAKAVNQSTTN